MAEYSRTTLATIAALQKKRGAPIKVTEKALVSHLYPFNYNESSDVSYGRAIDKDYNLKPNSPDISTLGFTFNIVKFSSIYRLEESDSYDTNTKLNISIEKVTEKIVDLGDSNKDYYDTNTTLSINVNKIVINTIEINQDDAYDTDTVLSIGINKV